MTKTIVFRISFMDWFLLIRWQALRKYFLQRHEDKKILIEEFKKLKKILVIIGSQKVEREVYDLFGIKLVKKLLGYDVIYYFDFTDKQVKKIRRYLGIE